DSKKVIIPAKYGWVQEYITGWTRKKIFYIATDLQRNRFLYNSDGEIIYTFKSNDDDEIEDLFTHNGKLYLILCDFDIEVEFPEKKDYRLLRIDKEVKELLVYPYIQRLGVKNLIYMWDSQHSDSIGFLDINTDRKIIGSHQDFYSR